jgi:hexosaminidase
MSFILRKNRFFILLFIINIIDHTLTSPYNQFHSKVPLQFVSTTSDGPPGTVLPLPQKIMQTPTQHVIAKGSFHFETTADTEPCELLRIAFDRYYKIIFNSPSSSQIRFNNNYNQFNSQKVIINRCVVRLEKNGCQQYPILESNEWYKLYIAGDFLSIEANEVWGALRGLETLSQLITQNSDGTFVVNDTYIEDYPRFPHRGILLGKNNFQFDLLIFQNHLNLISF